MVHDITFQSLKDSVGQEIQVSDWLVVTQEMINAFAELTGDRQWIHVDVERARRSSPYGTTIAHGYLILSLVTRLIDVVPPSLKATHAVNYGAEKLRFAAPVRAGSRIRARQTVKAAEFVMGGSLKLISAITVDVEDEKKPACYIETIVLYFP